MSKKFFLFVFSSALFFGSLESASVKILNDTPFPLSALIMSQNGKILGRQAVDTQKQMVWQNSNLQSQNSSQAPFTVIFHCADGSVYGTVTGVSSAGMVMASTAHGNRFCKPVKKKDKTGRQGQSEQSEDLNEKEQQQLKEYFKEKPDPEVQFKPKPINPQQWSDQDRF
ncbi:hypothetical protein COB11_03920 [Candidatus Aerophobetes bacterium]|uniref:Uncharacterized protein n=1 Tax=Aerophobetes bacterium TaxID=2030807 RepID=A0A2A4YHJ9_UNCAE|nr:MAG: hypothetical protein COB11_03920 [Candidatus Aerophobetes bacterium]